MPGAETWSAKEYKGFVYAGDMTRGFDVYGLTECEGNAVRRPRLGRSLSALCGVAASDADGDGLVDELEEIFGTSADDPDSDRDGKRDGNEDSDEDGESDEDEDDASDSCAQDSDGDGRHDEDEDD